MPPVFAQPSPVSRFSSSGGGGDYGSYASLARALQDRYASDADRQLRAQLGFAGLEEQRVGRQDELQLQAAALAMRPALEQQRADNEINNWMIQRRFNQSDQQELARQETAVSELQDKLDKGEISQNEFYQMIGQVAPRVNYLQAKERHTRVKAIEQQRTQEAELFKSRKELIDLQNSYMRGELDSQTEVRIPAQHAQYMSDYMADAYPELQKGTPGYDAKLKMEAMQQGRGEEWVKTKNGSMPISKVNAILGTGGTRGERGAGGASATEPEGIAANEKKMAMDAANEARKEARAAGEKFTQDDWDTAFDRAKEKLSGAGHPEARARAEARKTQMAANRGEMETLNADASLTPDQKMGGTLILKKWQALADKYPNPTPAIASKMNALLKQYQAFKAAVQKQQPGQQPEGATTLGGTPPPVGTATAATAEAPSWVGEQGRMIREHFTPPPGYSFTQGLNALLPETPSPQQVMDSLSKIFE